MARAKAENGGSSGPATGPTEDPKWWTHRECCVYLGGISKQKWGRLRAEHSIPFQTDERGIDRFSSEAVIEIGERLGLTDQTDATTVAMQVLRDVVESQSEYIKLLQGHNLSVTNVLREENTSVRQMNEKQQAAFLQALEATQEALDHSVERKLLTQQASSQDERMDLAMGFLMTEVAPKLMAQWKTSGNTKKIVELVRNLSDQQIDAVKALVEDERVKQAIDEIRAPEQKEKKTDEQKSA